MEMELMVDDGKGFGCGETPLRLMYYVWSAADTGHLQFSSSLQYNPLRSVMVAEWHPLARHFISKLS